MKHNYSVIIVIFLLSIICIRPSFAENTLRVGVFTVAPFAYQENGIYKGLAIDLWEKIAAENGWKYRYVTADHRADALLLLLNQKKLDVAVGSISVTNARLELAEFSRGYFINPMVLIVDEKFGDFFYQLKRIINKIIGYKYYLLYGVIIFCFLASLLWFAERGTKIKFTKQDLIWNVVLTFMTNQMVGEYKNTLTRVLAILLLLEAFIFWGLAIAVLTSAVTISMSNQITSLPEINNRPVAVGAGTFQETLAQELGLQYLTYNHFSDQIVALLNGEVEGVMVDMPTARYYFKKNNTDRLVVAPFILNYNEVAFGFQLNSPYVRKFNLSLTDLQDKRQITQLCKIYFGRADAALCGL